MMRCVMSVLSIASLLLIVLLPSRADDESSFQACEDTPLVVTSVYADCNNGYGCNYGDYADVTVQFDVVQELAQFVDNEGYDDVEVYAKFALYTPGNFENTYESDAVAVCGDYSGYSCSNEGSYAFQQTAQLGYANSEEYDYYPLVQVAFSLEANGGTELGGANVGECDSLNGGASYADDLAYDQDDDLYNSQGNSGFLSDPEMEHLFELIAIVVGIALGTVVCACGMFQAIKLYQIYCGTSRREQRRRVAAAALEKEDNYKLMSKDSERNKRRQDR